MLYRILSCEEGLLHKNLKIVLAVLCCVWGTDSKDEKYDIGNSYRFVAFWKKDGKEGGKYSVVLALLICQPPVCTICSKSSRITFACPALVLAGSDAVTLVSFS